MARVNVLCARVHTQRAYVDATARECSCLRLDAYVCVCVHARGICLSACTCTPPVSSASPGSPNSPYLNANIAQHRHSQWVIISRVSELDMLTAASSWCTLQHGYSRGTRQHVCVCGGGEWGLIVCLRCVFQKHVEQGECIAIKRLQNTYRCAARTGCETERW